MSQSHVRTLLVFPVLGALSLTTASAQGPLLQPGEAYVTRFSGTAAGPGGAPAINPAGTVGSIFDLRAPRQPPQGQHWVDEPQRKPLTAAEVGQVFGVALDDSNPPNIYLTATSAFGLHRTPDNTQWMPGMWGPGGAGAVYVLDRNAGYRPRVLAQVNLNGRPNSGAALGNIAYDKWHKQLFVSDLETGMIHRLRAADGADGGFYDHGVQGRANFLDAESRQPRSMAPIPFEPTSSARIADCPSGKFETTPECWNVAASGRRVWGVGVRRDPARGEVRLYYAVWSGPALGAAGWSGVAEDDKRNAVWSIRLGPDGGFDPSGVRREFLLPDFFVKPEDVARAGYSQPVSDIAFPECGGRGAMLIAERGGLRNLGLAEANSFATPHEARTLRYELYQDGLWRPAGRYDVGFYDRQKDGEPFMRANCAGGAAFGPGYTEAFTANRSPDQFVWITGDSLCSPDGPCNVPGGAEPSAATQPGPGPGGQPPAQPVSAQGDQGPLGDDSEVHGLQGVRETAFDEVAPAGAFKPYPDDGSAPYPPAGPSQAYLIDTDINVDATGNLIPDELTRNDATRIGDVAIFQICPPGPAAAFVLPAAPPVGLLVIEEGHVPELSHGRFSSHGRELSHYRWASHWPAMSHNRYNSWHDQRGSVVHDQRRSRVHNFQISVVHDVRPSFVHDRRRSIVHDPVRSRQHDPRRSQVHDLRRSSEHDLRLSRINHVPAGSHVVALSQGRHVPIGSHLTVMSLRGHLRGQSRTQIPLVQQSQTPPITHLTALSRRGHAPAGSHNAAASNRRVPNVHGAAASRGPLHSTAASRGPVHSTALSRARVHQPAVSRGPVKQNKTSTTIRSKQTTTSTRSRQVQTIKQAPRTNIAPRIAPRPTQRRCPPGQRC